jgi:hypothetical protein
MPTPWQRFATACKTIYRILEERADADVENDPELAAAVAVVQQPVELRLGDLIPSEDELNAMTPEQEARWAGIDPEMTNEQEARFAGVPLPAVPAPRFVYLPQPRMRVRPTRSRARRPARRRRAGSRVTRAGPDDSDDESDSRVDKPADGGRLGVRGGRRR